MLQLFGLFFMLINDTCETSPNHGMQMIFVYNIHFYIESNSIILITGGLPVSDLKGIKTGLLRI